jgi:hypothetical protein
MLRKMPSYLTRHSPYAGTAIPEEQRKKQRSSEQSASYPIQSSSSSRALVSWAGAWRELGLIRHSRLACARRWAGSHRKTSWKTHIGTETEGVLFIDSNSWVLRSCGCVPLLIPHPSSVHHPLPDSLPAWSALDARVGHAHTHPHDTRQPSSAFSSLLYPDVLYFEEAH